VKVYLVGEWSAGGEAWHPEGVFSTEEKANAAIRRLSEKHVFSALHLEVEEYELDPVDLKAYLPT
jgi:hypothetical protein